MATRGTQRRSRQKEIRAWGVRRREIDVNQLALAYYLLARIRIEQQRQSASGDAAADERAASPGEAA